MKNYVVKIGGHALDSLSPHSILLKALAEDVLSLRDDLVGVVIVHGGGPQINTLLEALGHESQFHEGLRVTDDVTMEYVAMALSQVNTHLVAALNQSGLLSVGLNGADSSLLRAQALGAPWFRAGVTPKVDPSIIESMWRSGVTPVVSSVALDDVGELVNCNADAAAGAIAGALGAEALVLLSDVEQLRGDPKDPDTALSSVNEDTVRHLLETGAARDGMRPKMIAALDALSGGARCVRMGNGTIPHALSAVLNGTQKSTEVVR